MNILMETFVGVPRHNIQASIVHLSAYVELLVAGEYVDDVTDARLIIKNLDFRSKTRKETIAVPLSTLMQTINHLRIYEQLLHAGNNTQEQYVTNTIAYLIDCEQAAISIFYKERKNGK